MSTYVLVHGAWHGAWCWYKVVPLLKQAGHKVVAIDLPGNGADKTPLKDITLETYVQTVCQIIDTEASPVILVGHSLGGTVISQVAEQRADKIQSLVYLSALMPINGETLMQLAAVDTDSAVLPNAIINQEEGYLTLKPETFDKYFYHDCPAEDRAKAHALRTYQPLAPFGTPVNTTEANFGRIERYYIESLGDKALSVWVQQKQCQEKSFKQVFSLNCGHAAFFADPHGLANHLLSI